MCLWPSTAQLDGAQRAQRPTTDSTMVDIPSRRLQAARGLWNEGRQEDAICLFNEAIRQEPNNVRTYVLAARAYAEAGQFDRMESVHEKLIARAPRHPGVYHYIGETFGLLKLPERAVASLPKGGRFAGAGPPTWMELASLHERAHRLDEAEELIERAVRSGYRAAARVDRAGTDSAQEKTARGSGDDFSDGNSASAARAPIGPAQAWSELALMRDSHGDFDGAIVAIERCKEAHETCARGHTGKASEMVHGQLRLMMDNISRDDFRRWRDELRHLEPRRTALLTGFPRSGTTLLEQLLDAHPDLVSSEERDFIGRELYTRHRPPTRQHASTGSY